MVIALIAILAVVVILTLNPVELLKQGRDSRRLGELATLSKAISIYQTDQGGSLGVASTTYVSIPDTSPTCANLGLPSLPTGWAYACAATTTYRQTDGSGWIPVNFQAVSFHSPLGTLPVDPLNTTSTGNYYTYVVGGTNNSQYELADTLESGKYVPKEVADGGVDPAQYEIGSNTKLTPFSHGLIYYAPLDGNASDSSGFGNNGTLQGAPSFVSGKAGQAVTFASTTDYVTLQNNINIQAFPIFSVAAWVKTGDPGVYDRSVLNSPGGTTFGVSNGSKAQFRTNNVNITGTTNISDNNWHFIAFVFNTSSDMRIYVDGAYDNNSPTSYGAMGMNAFCGISICLPPLNSLIGSVDEVMVWQRALSAAEIQAIYNATK